MDKFNYFLNLEMDYLKRTYSDNPQRDVYFLKRHKQLINDDRINYEYIESQFNASNETVIKAILEAIEILERMYG